MQVKCFGQMRQDLNGVALKVNTINLNTERIFNDIKSLTSISASMKSTFLKQLEGTKGHQAIKKQSQVAKLSKFLHVKEERLKITINTTRNGEDLINFPLIYLSPTKP